MAFVAFAKLMPGALFFARDNSWIKAPKGAVLEEKHFNAYRVVESNLDDPLVQLTSFPDEALVKKDPDGSVAKWALQKNKEGDP